MSGSSWGGRDRYDSIDVSTPAPTDGFSRANKAYSNPVQPNYSQAAKQKAAGPSVKMSKAQSAPPPPPPPAPYVPPPQSKFISPRSVDYSPRKHIKTTKANVLVIAVDVTGSLELWLKEILDRCCLLYTEAQKLMGNDLEIIFIFYGDTRFGDLIQVAPSGSGPELDTYIQQCRTNANGGGNGVESLELAMLYALKQIDTSTARTAYFFGITDEGAYPQLDLNDVDATLGLRVEPDLIQTTEILKQLQLKMHTFFVWCENENVYTRGNRLSRPNDSKFSTRAAEIRAEFETLVGKQSLAPLDLQYRVVDVMLAIIAKTTGQYNQFSQSLASRQDANDKRQGTKFKAENLQSVAQSVANIPGAPVAPTPPGGGTNSLLNSKRSHLLDKAGTPVIHGTGAVPKSLLDKK
jgi:hypothetical protein